MPLTLSSNARPLGIQATDAFLVTKSDTVNIIGDAANVNKYEVVNLYSDTGGTLKVTLADQADGAFITFSNIPAGAFLPLVVKRVWTATTASVIALAGKFDAKN